MSLEEYAAAFTAAFEGYQFPIALDGAALARRVRFEQYDLANSLLAYDGGALAGVAALAVRGEAGWVAGFAVVQGQRGRGRGRELMSALVGRARTLGLRRLSLEVLARNTPARRLYERAGMRVERDLLIMERAGGARGAAAAPDEAPARELLRHFERLHAVRPAWQRDLPALLAARLRGFRVGPADAPRAYALVGRALDGSDYISDLAAADAGAARELCGRLGAAAGTLKIVNEPEHSLFARPLLESGFVETERQHEMHMSL
ncbi:MAG TPA: GNAT family N-acetyltransferase [Pyrinomonadaceae bacterium]|nr:GNAT family N-acetyltransferase [Pyrinomonadaceae bacterium]